MGKAGGAVSPMLQAFVKDVVVSLFDGIGAVSDYGLRQYDNMKLGHVQHITAGGGTIISLWDWFAKSDTGATHFGIERDLRPKPFVWGHLEIPVARVGQFVPTVGRYAPWAQGVRAWTDNPNCAIKIPAHLRALPPGAANCAFISTENIARQGSDLVTDPQFNSNVLLRAWVAMYFQMPITPETQLWHAEFDPNNRCHDTGWPASLEDEMQEAARKLVAGDLSGLRGIKAPVPVTPQEKPMTRDEVRNLILAETEDLKNDVRQLQEQVWGEEVGAAGTTTAYVRDAEGNIWTLQRLAEALNGVSELKLKPGKYSVILEVT